VIYAMSDLHLQAPVEPFLFTHEKEATFIRVAEEALVNGATLLLAGDVFDLTAMTPPDGLARFYDRVGITRTPPSALGVGEQIGALKSEFGQMFAALASLARRNLVRFIPGNHDCAIASKDGRRALADALGVAPGDLHLSADYRVGQTLFGCHGNEYDVANQTAGTCKNPGSAITAALYHAIIPALDNWGLEKVGDGVPAVRPEENIVAGFEAYMSKDRLAAILIGFVELLRENHYFTGIQDLEMWFATHVLPGEITPAKVQARLRADGSLPELTRQAADKLLASGPDAPKLVVMGHTHIFDGTPAYVNLGTWIDHIAGLTQDEIATPDRSLPVLRLDEAKNEASVHDCRVWEGSVSDSPVMWTWNAA
jgi:UDP-2,3-diacylglucosamine pyrophosphatase LpxH